MTVNPKMYLCDTNVIVSYLLGETTNQATTASDLLNQAISGQIKVIVLEAVFVETIFVLSKIYKIPRIKLSKTMDNFLKYRGIINEDKDIWLLALKIYATNNFHIVDCLLIVKAKQTETQIITFDEQLAIVTASKLSLFIQNLHKLLLSK